jgi:predicted RNA-binding Zn ribbon-like protein
MLAGEVRRPFDFNGNHVVLDFTNTVNGRPTFTRDDLRGPEDLLEWAAAAGLVTDVDPDGQRTSDLPRFQVAVALRENLYRVFGPIAAGGAPEEAALSFVTRRAAQAMRRSEWATAEAGFEPRWTQGTVEAICDRLADEAVQLLRSPAIGRVGACAGCGWLFLDVSRARARRWCSMNVCGVRDKMRRYHQQHPRSASA